jgi:SAM-dependent methyltransferase
VSAPPDRYADVLRRVYPEFGAGGFTRIDGTVGFYLRVNALLGPDDVVVDLGAGRGLMSEDTVAYRQRLADLRGRAARVVGLDVDPVVRENPHLDEALLIGSDGRFPLADASVDMVVSDWTFEHVDDPRTTVAEIDRVLRPGGWVCARTPNKWGLIGMPTRAIPNRWHSAVLRRVQPRRKVVDTFPTRYRMNTRRALRTLFPDDRWENCSYVAQCEPPYVADSEPVLRAVRTVQRVLPVGMHEVLMVFVRKRESS